MGKHERLLDRLLRGTSDAGIPFEDLRRLLRRLNFDERIRGDHHLFHRPGMREKINIQRDGKHAKPYQSLSSNWYDGLSARRIGPMPLVSTA